MRWIILASAFLFASVAEAQQFVVVNKMPVTVVNRCGPVKAVVQAITTTYRQPRGHTHSHVHVAADGTRTTHTWDHQENSGHTCTALVVRNGRIERCGAAQYVQDHSPRLVTMTRMNPDAVNVVESPRVPTGMYERLFAPTAPAAVQSIPAKTALTTFPTELFGGGCANGNCSAVSTLRRR